MVYSMSIQYITCVYMHIDYIYTIYIYSVCKDQIRVIGISIISDIIILVNILL